MSWLWTSTLHVGDAVPAGHRAFLNGSREGALWGRIYAATPESGRLAAAEFIATAEAAVAAGRVGGKTVMVTGDGLLAVLIRKLIPGNGEDPPEVIIDTTGSTEEIRHAVTTLPRLGTLVLAGPPSVAELDLATYRDLHVRALTLVGAPWATKPARGVSNEAIGSVLAALRPDGLWCTLPGEPA
ncbi:hypothetical protein [Micromonospora sp. WMMD1082]|uniref:hypothetical protein n=1 Tax=Micromonospora sp. WMMD1082 TaxID=3016104 RepID=UPI0024162158|nr:hypothetical protein [Micromonospora sp. WMMD1082]MDG4793694.1 hypothetical protein [Micromonospora sp. WMMD1082]